MALRFPRLALLLAALLVFTGIPSFAEFYTDWLWYQELGYEQVFLKSLSAQATTGIAVGRRRVRHPLAEPAALAPPAAAARVRDRDA